jgi:hypothetical protein
MIEAMKTEKFFYYTIEMLQDRLATKLSRREDCKTKLEAYDKEIRMLEVELIKRQNKLK